MGRIEAKGSRQDIEGAAKDSSADGDRSRPRAGRTSLAATQVSRRRRWGRSALGSTARLADTSIVIAAMVLEPTVEESCELLAVVADPIRLGVLRRLSRDGACVCDLQPAEPIAANLLSYHLRVLRDAGLVHATKRGRWVDYELAPDALDRLHRALPTPQLADEAAP